jgi:hypothetical protein
MDARPPASPERTPSRSAWARAARLAGGWSLLLLGGALLLLPGPGIPLVIAGLALLARDLPWARRLAERLRARWNGLQVRARRPRRPPAV